MIYPIIGETFNGTGATVYLCLGGIPKRITICAVTDADTARLVWDRGFPRGGTNAPGGILTHTNGTVVEYAAKTGVIPYEGRELLTAAMQTTTANGEGVFLEFDDFNYRRRSNLAQDPGDAVEADIDTWTLDTAANCTGHFNADVNGTYIGVGSKVVIGDRYGSGPDYEAYVLALTAGQGSAADEVTLDRAIPSGMVKSISNRWSFKPMAVGKTTKAGIKLVVTTLVNVNNEVQSVCAEF